MKTKILRIQNRNFGSSKFVKIRTSYYLNSAKLRIWTIDKPKIHCTRFDLAKVEILTNFELEHSTKSQL